MLSVAQSTEQKDGKPQLARSITLEVTPEEAEKLSLASQEGQIVLALRGLGDDATTMTIGSNKRDLLSLAGPRLARWPGRCLWRLHRINIESKSSMVAIVMWWNSNGKGRVHEALLFSPGAAK